MHNTVTSLTQRRGVRQFVKFSVVGTSGLLVNLIVYTILRHVVPHASHVLQNNINYSVGFFAGGISNYYLNRIWTFRSTGHALREGAQFLTVSAIAWMLSLIILNALAPSLGHSYLTWFIATLGAIFVNFFLNKYWTFKNIR